MKPLTLSRREFLEISAGAGSSAALAQAVPSALLGQGPLFPGFTRRDSRMGVKADALDAADAG